ncbi:hypothetical protein F5Y10DRAFT_177003 [Nemania abortiva]|nr:hypothetical protein F5Y10DRAFT_177003 [Nemania abortiva]
MGSHHPIDDWSQVDFDRGFPYPTPSTDTNDYYDAPGTQWHAPGKVNTTNAEQDNEKVDQYGVDPFAKGVLQGHRRNPLGDWSYEALSITVAIGLIITIALVLKLFEDKEQPKWPHEITLNSVIAILSTILRALLAYVVAEVISYKKWGWFDTTHPLQHLEKFDAASRGVWGAIQLLFITYKPHMASFGAVLVISSLAIGPFTQQAIRTTVCQLPMEMGIRKPTVQAAHYVDPTDWYVGGHTLPAPYLRTPMKGAIVNGLTTSDSEAAFVGFDCPTGNCTFPSYAGVTYSSIGFCSRCTDITDSIRERFVHSNETSTNSSGYAFELTDGASINTFEQGSWMQVVSHSEGYSAEQIISFLTFTYESCSRFINATTGYTQYNCEHSHASLPHLPNNLDILATNCSISPCLRNYEGSVVNGALKETVVSVVPTNISDLAGRYRTIVDDRPVIKSPCLVDGQPFDTTNFSSVPQVPGRNFTWAIQDEQNITAPTECTYSMPWALNFGVVDFLSTSLNGTCLYEWLSSADLDPSVITCDWDGGNWLLENMYAGGNATVDTVSGILDNLATSITNRMRVTGLGVDGKGPGVTLGDALRTTVCTRVNWGWVALPAALTGLVLLLLVVAVTQSWIDSDARPVWKSSLLPLLFHGLGYEVNNQQMLVHVDQMKAEAQQMDVRLGKGELDFWLMVN